MTNIPEIPFQPGKNAARNFEILSLERLFNRAKTMPNPPTKPHRVNFYEVIFIDQGTGTHWIDFEPFTFGPGSVLFIHKDQVHAYELDPNVKGKIMLFTQNFLEDGGSSLDLSLANPFYLLNAHRTVFTPSDQALGTAQTLLDLLIQEQEGQQDLTLIHHLFASLILGLNRERPIPPLTQLKLKQKDHFYGFLNLLKSQITISRDANFYADLLGTTYKTLNHICQLATGRTPKYLIDSYSILEIKRALRADQTNAQQLAFTFGFEDPSNFTKYFKKHTGLTPKEFQRS